MRNPLSELVQDYIQGRASTRLEKWDKEVEKELKDAPEREDEFSGLRAVEMAKFDTRAWLSDAAQRAKQISFATHPPKFTHSDSKSSSVFVQSTAQSMPYLCTAGLTEAQSDVVGNAAALDVAGLLQLADGGLSLAQQIAANDLSALQPFAESEEQLAQWQQGFQQALASKELRSHALAKQLYFPLVNGDYHLLSPLFSSSLAHALHQRISDSRFSDAAKAIRQLKREEKFSAESTVDYVDVAVQRFGGDSGKQNISRLNVDRRGQIYLLNATPPIWQSQAKPPSESRDAFWRQLDQLTWRKTRDLKAFLIRVADRNNIRIREKRAEWVDDLIDILLQYAASIQAIRELAGWSAASKLPPAEQLWLDPWRAEVDADFHTERESKDWQQLVAQRFGLWLNAKLSDKALLMGDAEYKEWVGELQPKLVARMRDDIVLQQEDEQ